VVAASLGASLERTGRCRASLVSTLPSAIFLHTLFLMQASHGRKSDLKVRFDSKHGFTKTVRNIPGLVGMFFHQGRLSKICSFLA